MSVNNNQILTINNLGMRRSERWLFRKLNFQLLDGDVIHITGLNGAGKTSLLRCLCGLLQEAEGSYIWHEKQSQMTIPLFIGHLEAVKTELSVIENLLYHPLAGKYVTVEEIESAISEVQLSSYIDTPARHLSAGQKRRVALARLLLADTTCWILDEPFTSLDTKGCAWLEQKINRFTRSGGAVLLTSHQSLNLEKAPRVIDLSEKAVH